MGFYKIGRLTECKKGPRIWNDKGRLKPRPRNGRELKQVALCIRRAKKGERKRSKEL